jgi:hypothetical protein
MKRVSPGKKSKQAAPARKPALRRTPRSPKSKSTAKKPTPVKKTKPAAKSKSPKLRVTKTKRVSRPRKKTPATQVAALEKVAPDVSLSVLTRTRAKTKRKTARKKVVRAKRLALEEAPTPTNGLRESNLAVVKTASQRTTRQAAPKKTERRRITMQTTALIPAPVMPGGRSGRKNTPARKKISAPQAALPAFLFEGDEPGHSEVSGPGEKFSLGPTAPLDHFAEAATPLPESYGTGRLFLTACDPHWLYAHWDFTREEQFRHNARSVDRHLVLRVHPATQPTQTIGEYHVHPESKHWFVHVEQAGESYSAELGYYQTGRKWKSLTASTPQRTPPNNISADATVEFATLPLELSFETMLALLRATADPVPPDNVGLARAIESIRTSTREDFPEAMRIADWTTEQEQALQQILATAQAGAVLPSSQDSGGEVDVAETEFSFPEAPSSYVSSFFGGEMPADFWLSVNAELIVYGATQPGAQVHVAGKEIPLRPDGSFRFHFTLPDGTFAVPITASSASGADTRGAELKLSRTTEWRGAADAPPHEPALKPPPQSS